MQPQRPVHSSPLTLLFLLNPSLMVHFSATAARVAGGHTDGDGRTGSRACENNGVLPRDVSTPNGTITIALPVAHDVRQRLPGYRPLASQPGACADRGQYPRAHKKFSRP